MGDHPVFCVPTVARLGYESRVFGRYLVPFILIRTGLAEGLAADLSLAGYRCQVEPNLFVGESRREGVSCIAFDDPNVDCDGVSQLLARSWS